MVKKGSDHNGEWNLNTIRDIYVNHKILFQVRFSEIVFISRELQLLMFSAGQLLSNAGLESHKSLQELQYIQIVLQTR